MRRLSDPPIVAALVAPMEELRAALGSGERPEALRALADSAAATRATADPDRAGAYALESTDTAPAAVPAIRRTGSEVSALADHSDALAAELDAAYTTRDGAAAAVDRIIDDFRRRATPLAENATSQADIDPIIDLAAEAMRDSVSAVDGARNRMDSHTQRAADLDQGASAPRVTVPPGMQNAPGTLGTGGTSTPTTTDPAVTAQIALQNALIQGGVSLGTAAIQGGVSIGTNIIDAIVEVATHTVDTGAELVTHGMDKGAEIGTKAIDTVAAGADAQVQQALGGAPAQATTPAGTAPGGTGPFAGLGTPAPVPAPGPAPSAPREPEPEAEPEDQAPASPSPAPQATTPAPAPSSPPFAEPEPAPAPQTGPAVVPPVRPAPSEETERPRPRDGQAGITT